MKIFIVLCGIAVWSINAEIASSNKYGVDFNTHSHFLHNRHHSEHEKSVSQAKLSLQERLSQLEGRNGYNQASYGNAYGSSGSQKYVAGCSSCIGGSENRESYSNSRQSSSSQRLSSSGHGIAASDYEGVGVVSRLDDSDHEDVQSVVVPSYSGVGSSRYSSNAYAHEADEMQQRVVPADLSSVSSSAYRASKLSEHDEDDLQRTVGSDYGGASRFYSQSRGGSASETTRSGSAAVPVYVSGVSGSQSHRSSASQSQSESELNESRIKPIPTGQYVSISARPGTSTVLAVPVRVIHTQGVPDEPQTYYSRTSDQSASELSSSRVNPTTYRVTYSPSRNYVTSDRVASSNSEMESSRSSGSVQVQQPEKFTNYNTFNSPESLSQSRFRAEESDSHSEQNQVRVAPVTVSYPSNGGSSRFASTGSSSGSQHGYTQTRVAPVFNVNAIESSSSSRTAEEKEQRRISASRPTYISSSRVADQDDRSAQSSLQSGSTGVYYAPVSSQTRFQTQQQSGAGSQTQFQRQGQVGSFSPYIPSHSHAANSQSSADRLSTRFGTGVLNTHGDDLHTYMSESERLARLQQQQISGSSSNVAISNLDANRRTLNTASNLDSAAANFVRSSNLASRTSDFDTASVDGSDSGAGGYNRVRSWNKQSKWASGSEYGSDGKPKSFSHLSTAEAEKYNINGAETGYKAATTTLENDGKVSTYSIHTP